MSSPVVNQYRDVAHFKLLLTSSVFGHVILHDYHDHPLKVGRYGSEE